MVQVLRIGIKDPDLADRLAPEPPGQSGRGPAVVDRRGGDHHAEQQLHAVHDDMAFPAVHLLRFVPAPTRASGSHINRLTVDADGGPGLIRLFGRTRLTGQPVMDRLQGPVARPAVEVAPDGDPGREIGRVSAPLAPGAEDVEDRVDAGSHVGGSMTSTGHRGRDQRLDDGPLSVGEVIGVEWCSHAVTTPITAQMFPFGTYDQCPRHRELHSIFHAMKTMRDLLHRPPNTNTTNKSRPNIYIRIIMP